MQVTVQYQVIKVGITRSALSYLLTPTPDSSNPWTCPAQDDVSLQIVASSPPVVLANSP